MEEQKLKMNIGIPSFVTMFIILCLVTFAILSLVSAKHNQESNERFVHKIENYYQLQNKAQETLIEIDQFLQVSYNNSQSKEEYFNKIIQKYPLDTKNQYHFTTKSDTVELVASIEIRYPNTDESLYQVIDWYSHSTIPWKIKNNTDLLTKES